MGTIMCMYYKVVLINCFTRALQMIYENDLRSMLTGSPHGHDIAVRLSLFITKRVETKKTRDRGNYI